MSLFVSDDVIKWVPYVKEEKICQRYSLDDWHKAVHDVNTDEEWAEVLANSYIIRCYVLKVCSNNKSIAFLYTKQEDIRGKVYSIHGGGWEIPLLYYRGYILMIKTLLNQGFKVRTCCQLSNLSAMRFSRSVGFIPYRYSEDEVFMWINLERLKSSKLYHRFYST